MMTLPLNDYRILITRGARQAEHVKAIIEQHGGIPIMVPLLAFQVPENVEDIKNVLHRIASYDWLIVTSQNGVDFFFTLVEKYCVPRQSLPKIAVIGTKTAEALRQYGYKADFIPKAFVAEKFVEEFLKQLTADSRVLLAKGNLARTVISAAIDQAGAHCDEVIVYETVLPKESVPRLVHVLREGEVDVIMFTSSSTVHHFMEVVEHYQLHDYVESLIIACIGPIAEKTAVQYGLQVAICPTVYTTEAMLDELIRYRQTLEGE